ncbi:hypothetical protein AVEN_39894-1 [Araneus ventricosus]|uniref:Uncharacterized protein n=1 Tax=Araneus ventricosus TaxID=182803 RepID=A0A4Y2JRC9_ARAVE|nr:hypothetical protein AVEN_39894-1 [Araneus ventricosus]
MSFHVDRIARVCVWYRVAANRVRLLSSDPFFLSLPTFVALLSLIALSVQHRTLASPQPFAALTSDILRAVAKRHVLRDSRSNYCVSRTKCAMFGNTM